MKYILEEHNFGSWSISVLYKSIRPDCWKEIAHKSSTTSEWLKVINGAEREDGQLIGIQTEITNEEAAMILFSLEDQL